MNIEIVKVTPDMARQWLSERLYNRQRTIRSAHVKFLTEEMLRGTFVPGTQIRFSILDGKYNLLDGQHRMAAVVASNTTQVFSILSAETESEEQEAIQYGNLDTGLRRTFNDMGRALQLTDELGFTATQINELSAASTFIRSGFIKSRRQYTSRSDLVKWIRDYSTAGQEYYEIAAGCTQEIRPSVGRRATLAVALVTFLYSEVAYGECIEQFWRGAIFDDALRVGDPRKVAYNHLMTTRHAGGGYHGRVRDLTTSAYSARYLANCFNAYVEQRSLTGTKVIDHNGPIKILGSPFRGKEGS